MDLGTTLSLLAVLSVGLLLGAALGVLIARTRAPDLADSRQRIDRLSGIPVAVGADEDLGPDLAEAVEHAVGAEVGRA